MDGPMSTVDPDEVENDAGGFWRTLYKLEKNFSENPKPLSMASKVYRVQGAIAILYSMYEWTLDTIWIWILCGE